MTETGSLVPKSGFSHDPPLKIKLPIYLNTQKKKNLVEKAKKLISHHSKLTSGEIFIMKNRLRNKSK